MAAEALTFPPAAAGRATLVFCVDGLAPRDATLFKSFVRLLDHRTHQRWCCGSGLADLHVVPEGGSAPRDHDQDKPASAVLTVGTTQRYLDHYLNLPIRADELETELNRLGALILSARPACAAPDGARSYRLLRWPPPSYLGSAAHVRLATLMVAGAVSLESAQARSGLSACACGQFFEEMGRIGLLRSDKPVLPAARPRSDGVAHAQPSLLALIRNRLGLVAPRQ